MERKRGGKISAEKSYQTSQQLCLFQKQSYLNRTEWYGCEQKTPEFVQGGGAVNVNYVEKVGVLGLDFVPDISEFFVYRF